MTPLNKILAVARAGNPSRAWALFCQSGWQNMVNDPKALTLKARLLKDQAKRAIGGERMALYGKSAEAYAAAAGIEPTTYPLINAATLTLLSGKADRAAELAMMVVDLLDTDPAEAETSYWLAATRSEALLLLGKVDEAREILNDAMLMTPNAWEDHAATIGQFDLILTELGQDSSWLDQHRPPTSLYFSGLIGLDQDDPELLVQIDEFIERRKIGFGFGALTAGADILIAESLDRAGAQLHITLPYSIDHFRQVSLKPFGAHWQPRFERLLGKAVTVNILSHLPGEEERPIDAAVDLGNLVAMGHAIRNAQILCSRAVALTIIEDGGNERRRFADWQVSGHDYEIIHTSRISENPHVERPESGGFVQKVAAILWVEDLDEEKRKEFHSSGITFIANEGGCFHISDDLVATVMIARKIVSQPKTTRAGLVIDTFNINATPAAMIRQAADLATASEDGTLFTDQKSAMALTLLSKEHRFQEIGELNTAYGAMSLWSIT